LWGHTDSVDSTIVVDIIVFPGLVVLKVKELGTSSAALGEVSADDLLSELSTSLLGDIECTVWLWVLNLFTINTLNGVVLDKVLSEFVDWCGTISSITLESLWKDSLISVLPVSVFVNGSWEFVHTGFNTTPCLFVDFRLLELNKRIVVHGGVELVLVLKVIGVSSDKSSGRNNTCILHFLINLKDKKFIKK